MTVKERIIAIRLHEKINRNQDYAQKTGIYISYKNYKGLDGSKIEA